MKLLTQYKAAVRKIVPQRIYQPGSAIYRRALALVRNPVLRFQFGIPDSLIHFGIAPGDDLLCTVVLRELKKRGHKIIWIMSNHPELFDGNPDVAKVLPVDSRFRGYANPWREKYKLLEYATYDPQLDRAQPTTRHVIAELCARAGVTGEVALRPYLFLTGPEMEKAGWATGMVAIQNSGVAAKFPIRNKEWFPERFQEVVNRLKNDFKFIQIGSPNDPLLQNTLDMRGKTSVRESAAILSQARLFVGLEGFAMHLARAAECPSVIVLGGRTAPWQFCYSCNVNLYSALPCSPCWLWNRCDYGKACMDMITVDDVINGIGKQSEKQRGGLAVDKTVI